MWTWLAQLREPPAHEWNRFYASSAALLLPRGFQPTPGKISDAVTRVIDLLYGETATGSAADVLAERHLPVAARRFPRAAAGHHGRATPLPRRKLRSLPVGASGDSSARRAANARPPSGTFGRRARSGRRPPAPAPAASVPPADKPRKRDYVKLKVAELKDLLRGRGLKVSGKKAELVERLEASEED